MNSKGLIKLQINPRNPVQYLACCGILEIVARFDSYATSRWVVCDRTELVIDSTIEERALMICLIRSLTDWTCWSEETSENGEITSLNVTFHLDDKRSTISLDWWYETLDIHCKIKEKSAWKMYTGQQTAHGKSRDMVQAANKTLADSSPETITDLIRLNIGMDGRFGFDPRSSRNSLDTGFSSDDLKIPVATYPFAELLAVIGAHFFFPHRTKQSGGNESTRGWIDKRVFRYGAWTISLPVALARMAASCAGFEDAASIIAMRSLRASRDRYSNLTMASQTTLRR
jgi:CRISPR-associated protein Csb3